MEKMGKQMVKHCGGLPLAVRVLGGLLAAKYTLHDWERLYDNIRSHIVGGETNFNEDNNISLNHVLSLSFAELPSYLKYCFLYLAHFVEDDEIDVKTLSYYWTAEGILNPRHYDGKSITDVGESKIQELVRRNMVISKRDVTTLRFETCHLHDIMREICLSKAKEEKFLHIFDIRSQTKHSQTTSRRFVSNSLTIFDVKNEVTNPKIRSLVLYNLRLHDWEISSSSFTRLQLLRVLHIPFARFEGGKLPSSIGELIHLRYLNLESTMVFHIPASLGNLKLLIYLNINLYLSYPYPYVPNVLMGMKDLRYLALPHFVDEKTKLELSNLVELETLINFSTNHSNLEDLHGMTKLRNLGIRLTGERSLETLYASIGGHRHMENLNIEYYGAKKMIEEHGTVLDFINLKQLDLGIYCSLSDVLHFPSHLTRLSLYSRVFEEDPMPILEKLLHLKEVYLLDLSFSGRKMVCSAGGFPQLQKLKLAGLKELEEWTVEEGSMHLLHTLIIRHCEKLKELPDRLRFITSLKHLDVRYMGEKWKDRLSEGGEDYYKFQYISSVTFLF